MNFWYMWWLLNYYPLKPPSLTNNSDLEQRVTRIEDILIEGVLSDSETDSGGEKL